MKIRSFRNGFTLIRTLRSKNLIRVQSAFTLIELLVVISIIGILAAVVTVSFTSAQKQARDTARKSDLALYRTSLQIYATKNKGLYPSEYSMIRPSGTAFCTLLGAGTNCPEDSKYNSDNTFYYRYQSTGTAASIDTATASEYVLWTNHDLEASTGKWAVCSNGKSGIYSGASGLPPTSGTGTCPF